MSVTCFNVNASSNQDYCKQQPSPSGLIVVSKKCHADETANWYRCKECNRQNVSKFFHARFTPNVLTSADSMRPTQERIRAISVSGNMLDPICSSAPLSGLLSTFSIRANAKALSDCLMLRPSTRAHARHSSAWRIVSGNSGY